MLVDWAEIEQCLFETVVDAITFTVAANAGERFYGGAFWLLYGDYTKISAPVFGLNAESSNQEYRWHPPNWRWSPIDTVSEHLKPLYAPLGSLQIEERAFEALWEEHIDVLARVSRLVTHVVRAQRLAAPGAAFTPEFFVGIVDFGQGDVAIDYLRRSVAEEIIAASRILI